MKSNKKYSDPEVLQLIFNNRKIVFITTLFALLFSTIVSFLLPVYFKSSVILYPSTVGAVSKILVEPSANEDFLAYGSEQNAEHLLQFLESSKVKGFITEKHQLFAHYGFDDKTKNKETKLNKLYKENFKFKRTKLGSVLIEVYDKNPNKAADMANDVAAFADSVRNNISKAQAQKALLIVDNELIKLQRNLKNVEDSLSYYRTMGLIDYKSQAPLVAATLGSTDKEKQRINQVFAKYSANFNTLQELQVLYSEQFALYKARRDIISLDAEANYNYAFIVDKAYAAQEKAKPVRWLIVLSTTVAAFLFCVIFVLIKFRFSQLSNGKQVENK